MEERPQLTEVPLNQRTCKAMYFQHYRGLPTMDIYHQVSTITRTGVRIPPIPPHRTTIVRSLKGSVVKHTPRHSMQSLQDYWRQYRTRLFLVIHWSGRLHARLPRHSISSLGYVHTSGPSDRKIFSRIDRGRNTLFRAVALKIAALFAVLFKH